MKTITRQPLFFLYSKIVLLILLGYGFIGLYAQSSPGDIVPAGSTVKKLSSNQFLGLEGPVWYNDSVVLFVDDFMAGSTPDIYKYDPVAKKITKWPTNSTHCTGLSCDRDGNLIGASSTIIKINKAGQLIKILASGYNGKPFDSPNDLIADAKGGVYFSDPDFFVSSPPQDKTAVYYIDSTGNVKRVIDDLAKPNGLVLSPDGSKLYVDAAENQNVYSWDVADDGSVSGKITFAGIQSGAGAYADGMAIDINGNIYVATDKGIQVFSPQGTAITTIVTPENTSNCDFGGSDFKTLYITGQHNLYSIDLNYPGFAVSRKAGSNSVNAISDKPVVELFPNPVRDLLSFRINSGKINSIEILDLDGKKEPISLKKENVPGIEINTQKFKPGMYLLRINYNGGMITRKFIKE